MIKRLCVEAPLPFGEAAGWATAEELAAARTFAPARAQEYLAWRAVVRRTIGRDACIGYNAAGAPVVTNYPFRIAVSHCPGGLAVGISGERCALDIERIDRRFDRILPRYLTPAEQALSDDPLFPAIAWCAKETLYKYAGRTGCDLLRDLRIEGIRFPEEGAAAGVPTGGFAAGASDGPADELPEGVPAGIACGTLFAQIGGVRIGGGASCGSAAEPLRLHFYRTEEFGVVFRFD